MALLRKIQLESEPNCIQISENTDLVSVAFWMFPSYQVKFFYAKTLQLLDTLLTSELLDPALHQNFTDKVVVFKDNV